MANPFYRPNNQRNKAVITFPQFIQMLGNQSPTTILQNLLQSGKVSQQQLDIAQEKAQQMQGQFEQFRSLFDGR